MVVPGDDGAAEIGTALRITRGLVESPSASFGSVTGGGVTGGGVLPPPPPQATSVRAAAAPTSTWRRRCHVVIQLCFMMSPLCFRSLVQQAPPQYGRIVMK